MPTTSRFAIPYPSPDDNPDGPAQMQALAERVDAAMFAAFPGDLKFSARTGEHGNWIKADGRALAAGQYDALRNALIADGSPFGASGGNPLIPDLRARMPLGAGTGYPHGGAGGAASHVLTTAQMPSHSHSATSTGDIAGAGGTAYRTFAQAGSGASQYKPALVATTVAAAGGGQAHNNMPPYAVGTWFVYAA